MIGQYAEEVFVVALQCGDERVTGRNLEHRRAEARWTGEIGFLGEYPDQVINEAEETAADEADQKILFRRPVQINGAFSDMSSLSDIGDGETSCAAADEKLAGCCEKPGCLRRVLLGQFTEGGAHRGDYILAGCRNRLN